MKKRKDTKINGSQEVNLKQFFQKVYKNKWLFVLSICSFLAMTLAYIFLATPKYEVSTSILIDSSGSNRALGESKYIEGGVSLIEVEKNLYNEVGILKSFSLVRQTVEDLGFDITYKSGNWLMKEECYGYFPIGVTLYEAKAQLYDVPFEVEILSNKKYKLTIEGKNFKVLDPKSGSTREVKRDFSFSKEYSFGDVVSHEYFTFTISKPDYDFNSYEDTLQNLSFIVHNLDDVANKYLTGLEVNNIDIQASIFKIVSYGALVDKEVDFLKRLTENYVQNKLESRNGIASGKEEFIRSQLREVSDSLARIELQLEHFKKNKSALNLGLTATNALGQTSNLQAEKAKIELDIKFYNSLIANVQKNQNTDDFVIPTSIGIEDPMINANLAELKSLYAERAKKKFYLTGTNQEMNILNQQIQASTSLLLNNMRNAIKSLEYAKERVEGQLANYNGVINSLPERENALLSIERQSTLYGNLFNYLSQELAKTGIARAESTSDTRVLDEARMVGDGPVAPQKMLLLVLAVVLGTMIPMAWLALFSKNETIENVEQIFANCDIPVIASIAHHDPESLNSDAELSLWNVKESFRYLTSNLKYVKTKGPCVVLGITSIFPEEGKTYNAINLGITLAESGKRTLIIDADIRKPSLVKGINVGQGKGLTDYLNGDIILVDDIIHFHEELNTLHFVPTSTVNGNVHKLLSGPKMKALFLDLTERYDYIILDTPPVGLVSDFLLFRDLIDINLFVLRKNIAKIGFLKDIDKLISQSKKKKSFIIFNDVSKKDHYYGYEQSYGQNKEKPLVTKALST